jgi:hypothetical protein
MDRKHIALLVAAGVVPVVGMLALVVSWNVAVHTPALAHAILWTAGGGGVVCGVASTYALLRHARPRTAALGVGLVCFPGLLLSIAGLYGELVLRSWL